MISMKSFGFFLINIFLRKKLIFYFCKKLDKIYIKKNFQYNFKKTDWFNYQDIALVESGDNKLS